MIKKKVDFLKGILIYPNVSEIPDFMISKIGLKEFYITRLSGGIILKAKEPSVKIISFDFDEEEQDYWPGYVRGFLYPDKKFIGKAHYFTESDLKEESLNGIYKYNGKTIEVKGTWYDHENSKYGFYFMLNQSGEIPVLNEKKHRS